MRSDATTIADYLDELPGDRRAAVGVVCERIEALTPGVVGAMRHGMPFYERDGDAYIAVASQRHHVSVYVVGLGETLADDTELAAHLDGVDRGKSCLRFRPSQLDRLTPALLDPLIIATRDR